MSDFTAMANEILSAVGGSENVVSVLHCMTRLRFNLKNVDVVDDAELKAIEGVVGAQFKGGQYQVIIGPKVPDVYDAVIAQGVSAGGSIDENLDDVKVDAPKEKLSAKSVANVCLDYVSGSVVPLIPLITTGALFKAIAAVAGPTILNLVPDDSSFMFICNMVYNAAFYFMPIVAGYAAAAKLGMNAFMGAFMGAILIEPSFIALASTEGAALDVFGIPVQTLSYSSSLVPALLSVAAMAPIYRFFEKHLPDSVRVVFSPFLTVLVMLPISLCLLAPLGNMIGNGIAVAFEWLYATPIGWLAVTLIAATWGLLVITGMHLGLAMIALAQFAQTGQDTMVLLAANVQSWCYAAACLAVYFQLKDKKEKALTLSYIATNILAGVGEPMLFGVYLRYKRPFIAAIAGCAASGLYAALTNVVLYNPISGFLVPLSYIGGDPMNEVNGVIAMVLGAVVAFIVSWFVSLTPEQKAGKAESQAV